MASRTPLYAWHAAHGARMVDFAGWDMPVQYQSIVEEHRAVRTSVGIFDISHMGRLALGGAGALAWIQRVYTNNAATLKDGQARYGLVCNDAGGIRDDVLVYKWPAGYAIVVNASNRAKIVAWLDESRDGLDVHLTDQTAETAMIAVQGPRALELCRGLVGDAATQLAYYFAAEVHCMGQPCVVSRTGYTGEDGLEITIGAAHAVPFWEELVRRGAKACGLGARDTLRLEAAMPLYGHELNEETDPFQAGLGWAVKLDKGDFRGRAALLARKADPSLRRRIGLELRGKRVAREGAAVVAADKTVGVITSGTFAPTFNKPIAMAYVDPEHQAVGTAVVVDVRGTAEPATVVPLPFYRRSKA